MPEQATSSLPRAPRIGVALSGASGRAIAHIGVLEVLKENGIHIDYIVGCSSGSLVAASFATGTMAELKQTFHEMTFSRMLQYWTVKNAKGGLFQMAKAEELFSQFTKGLPFDQVTPKIGFAATDINTGELVTLKEGDMLAALKASVAVPGMFEPIVLNGRVLVDGGLVNVVPTKPVQEMGADIVIGINLAATKFIFEKRMPIWRGYRFITKLLGLQFIREKIITKLSSRVLFQFDSQSDVIEEEDIKIPGMWTMIAKAVDHSFTIEEQWKESDIACDLMIEPRVKHYGKAEFNNLEKIYQEGRRAAQHALPKIRELIAEKQGQKIHA
jgi:NTE family protein